MLENAIRAENKRIWEEGELEGLLEARAETKLEGAYECTLQVARIMLQHGEPFAKIQFYSGLSEKTLCSLQIEHETSP